MSTGFSLSMKQEEEGCEEKAPKDKAKIVRLGNDCCLLSCVSRVPSKCVSCSLVYRGGGQVCHDEPRTELHKLRPFLAFCAPGSLVQE